MAVVDSVSMEINLGVNVDRKTADIAEALVNIWLNGDTSRDVDVSMTGAGKAEIKLVENKPVDNGGE